MSPSVQDGFPPGLAFPTTDNPREELEQLESEITRVESLLASLLSRRAPLKRNVNRQYSPMLSLPVELCSEIFATCFPPNPALWVSGTPLILGQVCTAWRNLAWSMPWLWNTVRLESNSPSKTHVELLEEWIARSGQLPLSIFLGLHLDIVGSTLAFGPTDDVIRLMDVLTRCSDRWYCIDFDIPFFFPRNRSLCNLTPTKFPLLTSVSIQVACVSSDPMDFFLNAPNLRDVQLRNFPQNSIVLPFHQITRLFLSPTTVHEALAALGNFPNLTHCTLEDIIGSDVVNPVPILAQSLIFLEVINFTHTPLSELLDVLFLPSVCELSFHVTGNTFPHWSFVSLIKRSSCTLQRLALNGVRLSEWHLWDCLQATPSLLSLCLTNMERVTKDTLLVLNPLNHARLMGSSSRYLLPLLQEFAYVGPLQISFAELASTLQGRWTGGVESAEIGPGEITRLKSFKFITTAAGTEFGTSEEIQLGNIKQLVRDGMDVSIIIRDRQWI